MVGFVLLVAGILILYGEFIWVGKLVFGVSGAIVALAGLAMLWRLPHNTMDLVLIAGSMLCFFVEAGFETYWIGGTIGTVLFGWGFWRVIPNAAIFPVSAVFGLITTWLLSISRRARGNKLSL